jgi:hypothetical protein
MWKPVLVKDITTLFFKSYFSFKIFKSFCFSGTVHILDCLQVSQKLTTIVLITCLIYVFLSKKNKLFPFSHDYKTI